MKVLTGAVLSLILSSSPAFAQDRSTRHSEHSFFEPITSINLLGTVHNQVSEDWDWYFGIKTVFFHPTKHIWIGGIGFGVALHQAENRRNWTGLTLVPIKLGDISLEVSAKKVWAQSSIGNRKQKRLVMLAWNWDF